MTRMDQVADDVTELKVMVGKIITTLEHRHEKDKHRDSNVEKLQQQMATALIPIQFAKWAVTLMGGISVAVGLVYAVVQVAQAVGNGGVTP